MVQLHQHLHVQRQAGETVVCGAVQRQPRQRVVAFEHVSEKVMLLMLNCKYAYIIRYTHTTQQLYKFKNIAFFKKFVHSISSLTGLTLKYKKFIIKVEFPLPALSYAR